MADHAAVQLRQPGAWSAFLQTAARLYKYPYLDQLMIYAQRPDATACAAYDLWNDRMGRYVKRGARGIALMDDSGDRPALRYVFDVSDTGTRRESRAPWLTAALWSSWRSSPRPCPPSIGMTTGRTFSTSLTVRSWRRMMTIPSASNFALPPPSAWPTPCYPAAALPRRKSCTMRTSCPSSTSTPRRPLEPWGLR